MTAWADDVEPATQASAVDSAPADEWQPNKPTKLTPDQAKKRATEIVKLAPNPDEAAAKIKLAQNVQILKPKWSLPFLYNNANGVSKALYGPFENPGSASSKLETYRKNTALDEQINRIHGLTPLGPLPAEDQKKVAELEKQKKGDTLGSIPKFAADVVSGIGTFVQATGVKIDYAAQAASEFSQGIIAMGFQALGVEIGQAGEYHFDMSAEAQRNFIAQVVGASNRAAREASPDKSVSLPMLASGAVVSLSQDMLALYPAGRASEVVSNAVVNAALKATLKGGLVKAGDAVAKQGAVAMTVAAWNNLVTETGKELNNATTGKDGQIPLKPPVEQLREFGMSTASMMAGGLLVEGGGHLAGKLLNIANGLNNEMAKVPPDENVGGAKASAAVKADQFIDEAAKDRQGASEAKAAPKPGPIIESEVWDNGTKVDWVASPFAKLDTKVESPKGSQIGGAVVETIPIGDLKATQSRVTVQGIDKPGDNSAGLPLVVQSNGVRYIQDGHHRLAKELFDGKTEAQVRILKLDDKPLIDSGPAKSTLDPAIEAQKARMDALGAQFAAKKAEAEDVSRGTIAKESVSKMSVEEIMKEPTPVEDVQTGPSIPVASGRPGDIPFRSESAGVHRELKPESIPDGTQPESIDSSPDLFGDQPIPESIRNDPEIAAIVDDTDAKNIGIDLGWFGKNVREAEEVTKTRHDMDLAILRGDTDLASYASALQSAREEAKMNATLRARQAVATEKERQRAKNKLVKDVARLRSVDPTTFDTPTGNAIREIQDHFKKLENAEEPARKEPKTKTFDIDALRATLDEARSAHEDLAPELAHALDSMPNEYEKLSLAQREGLMAVIKNLELIKRTQGKLRTAEGWVLKADLQADAEKSIDPPQVSTLGRHGAKVKRNVTSAIRTFINGFSMNGEIVFGGKGTLVHKTAVQDVLNARREYILDRQRQQDPARGLLRERMKIDQQRNPPGWNDYWNKTFTEDGVTLTRNEIMDNFMALKDKNHRQSLLEDGTTYASHVTNEGNPMGVEKLSGETYDKFFSHLGKDEYDLMDIATRQEAENGKSLSDYNERKYGHPLEIVEDHWRKYVVHEGVNYEADLIDQQNAYKNLVPKTDESGLISRTGALGATHTTGFWDKFTSSTDDAALITKMGESVSNANKVLNDEVISRKIRESYGESTLRQLREDLASESNQRETPKQVERVADMMGNLASNAHLGLVSSLRVPLKLWGLGKRSVINNPHGFIPGTLEMIIHGKRAAAAAREFSSMASEAYRSGGSIDLQQMSELPTTAGKALAVGKKLQSMNMFLTRGGSNVGYTWDATTARFEVEHQFNRALKGKGMDPVFKGVTGLTEDMVKSLTPEQKLQAIGQWADTTIGESHAVSDPGYRLGAQKTALGRSLTKFKSEPLKGFEQIRRLGMRFSRDPSLANAGKLFSAIVVYGAAEGLMIYGIDEGVNALFGVKQKRIPGQPQSTPGERLMEEEQKADLSMIPMIGDMVNEHLYLARHPGASSQLGAVMGMAVLPLNTILDTVIMHAPGYTPSQRKAAGKRLFRDLKSIFNVPLNIENMLGQ